MKNKLVALSSFATLLLVASILTLSCNKKFDAPPTSQPIDITANTSIATLKALHSSGNYEQINDSDIIEGVVVADDSSGNFYKEIVIQDSTSGIVVLLDGYDLYTTYPIGAQIFIKAKGLYLGDYDGQIELGAGQGTSTSGAPQLNSIASALFSQYIEVGTLHNVITPRVVTVSQLTTNLQDPLQSTLIQLNNFQFANADTSKTYAVPSVGTSTPQNSSFTISDCSGNSITLYNSGYATFAGLSVPNGNGSIVGIDAPYNSTPQILIRDTSDVQFTGTRCDGSGGGGGGGTMLTSIGTIRALYSGSDVTLGSYQIGGVVISDLADSNISKTSLILQDGSYGISIYFGSTAAFSEGDSIVLNVSGDVLTSYNGALEIDYTGSLPAVIAHNVTVTPQVVTISQLTSPVPLPFENTLVEIEGATSTAGTFSGNRTLTDATGSITMYTSKYALFSGTTVPTGSHNWTGYVNAYKTSNQFQIRNTSDIQ